MAGALIGLAIAVVILSIAERLVITLIGVDARIVAIPLASAAVGDDAVCADSEVFAIAQVDVGDVLVCAAVTIVVEPITGGLFFLVVGDRIVITIPGSVAADSLSDARADTYLLAIA